MSNKRIYQLTPTTPAAGQKLVVDNDQWGEAQQVDASDFVLPDAAQTLTNKTIDASQNTISGLQHAVEVDNPSSGVHGVTGNIVGDSDTQTLTNKTIDASQNTISGLRHGVEVDNPSSGVHGVSGNIVGDSDIQTLTNKTINANQNTISGLRHGTEVDNPSSGVHGVTGNIVGDSDAQTLTNKTIDASQNTITGLQHGVEVDNPSSGVHGVTGNIVGDSDAQTLTNKTIDAGQNTISNIGPNELTSAAKKATINFLVNGGGNDIPTGTQGYVRVDFAATIQGVRLYADQAGNVTVDIQKCTHADFPTASSICGSSQPSLSSAQKYEDTTLTGWTTAINAGDILIFSTSGVSGITKLTVALEVERT